MTRLIHFCVLSLCFWSIALAQRPSNSPADAKLESELATFSRLDSKNSVPRRATLFVGSSSIEIWQTAYAFPHSSVINRGIGGARTLDVLRSYDLLVRKYAPTTVVIYIGENDLAEGRSPVDVASDVEALIGRIHRDFPRAKIIFLSIKPSVFRWSQWPSAQEVNRLIRRRAAQGSLVKFVDVASPLLDAAQRPDAQYYRADQLHLNDKGYALWTKLVLPLISSRR